MVGPILYSKIVFGSVSSTVVELTVDYGLRFLETGAE
jgi:hypothetical protein